MEASAERAVTAALDASIASVAAEEFDRLRSQVGDGSAVARKIHGALDSFRGPRDNRMPRYDSWDALFYLTWYQPAQVNLAYTLARRVPEQLNPLLNGGSGLQVGDFGCGALAMQFGLALAAADTLKKHGDIPRIAISSKDGSRHMKLIGQKLWCRFVEEIAEVKEYPELDELREICSSMVVNNQGEAGPGIRWLTALHVAYRRNNDSVKAHLNCVIEKWKPDSVLVTARPEARCWAYSPDGHAEYTDRPELLLCGDELALQRGCFKATTKFRFGLYEDIRHHLVDALNNEEDRFLCQNYLSRLVEWYTPGFEAACSLHTRG